LGVMLGLGLISEKVYLEMVGYRKMKK